MKTMFALLLFCLSSVIAFAQTQNFPMLIKAGETKQVSPTAESAIVLLGSQLKTYEDSLIELKYSRAKITLLEKENALQIEKQKIYERDTAIYANLYHHYYTLWDSTDHRLEATEIKLIRTQHSRWNLGLTGMLIGVIATLLIHK